jgi:hypothetical protein
MAAAFTGFLLELECIHGVVEQRHGIADGAETGFCGRLRLEILANQQAVVNRFARIGDEHGQLAERILRGQFGRVLPRVGKNKLHIVPAEQVGANQAKPAVRGCVANIKLHGGAPFVELRRCILNHTKSKK